MSITTPQKTLTRPEDLIAAGFAAPEQAEILSKGRGALQRRRAARASRL